MRLKLAILLAGLFLFFPGLATGQEATEEDKLRILRKEIQESQEKLRETKKERQAVLSRLVEIQKELQRANQQLGKAKERIEHNEKEIGHLSQELQRASTTLKGREALLKQRLREAYKSSGANYLELLLAARSMSDFINRTYFFEKITARDAALIKEIKGALHQVKSKRDAVSSRTTEIKKLAQIIDQEKQKIAETVEEKKALSQKLREREAEFERKIAKLEEDSRKLESLIQKKMGERGRAGIVSTGTGRFIWPLQGMITSRFGEVRRWGLQHRHSGLDIAAPHGAPIKAADSGEVIFSGWWGGYGKAIVIDHGRGLATVYAHLSRLYVSEGAKVTQGQIIGLEGSTGYSTGPHLHFEVRRNGTPQDPIRYLP